MSKQIQALHCFTVCPNCGFTLDCAPRQAADQLLELMEDISEDRWCAGWLVGLEYELWEEVLDGKLPVAKDLADVAGGWWIWSSEAETTHQRRFVPMDEWLVMYQAGLDKQAKEAQNEPPD